MSRYIVRTPAPGHTGNVGAVHFQDGVAEVNDETHAAELAYMHHAGYHIRPADEAETEVDETAAAEVDSAAAKPKKTAPVGDWRVYATTQGLSAEEADALTKNQLVERFADEEENL